MLNKKGILITGGTGSFGQKFVEIVLKKYPHIKRLVIYSRDEMKQFEMSQKFNPEKHSCLRYFIGDVRDRERLKLACEDIDIIIHAAALKHVPVAEYNPIEFIKTNVLGADNIIYAAMNTNVKMVVALSTDKAVAPINLYGATKLCSDKLFVSANNMVGKRGLKFSVVRYGNVIGSRGSVVPFFLEKRKTGFLPVTHPKMTRFNISLNEGVELVLFVIKNAWGGEIFVPKLPSFKIIDVVKAVAPYCKIKYVGIRPGEKIHEEMITETDGLNTVEMDKYYVILPTLSSWLKENYIKKFKAKSVKEKFAYNSGNNNHWLNVEQLKQLIKKHVDSKFEELD